MNTCTKRAVRTCGLLLVLANAALMADTGDSRVGWSTGLEYSTGTYGGTEDIEDLYLPITANVDFERVSFELTVPYLSVRAPMGTTVADPGTEPLPGSGETTTESGLGDVVAGVTVYDVIHNSDTGFAMDLTGKIKFGTADANKGLGTGEQDYTVRADFYRFFERITLMGSAGYKLRGDPSDLDLRNVIIASIGAVFEPTEAVRFGFDYNFRESAFADGDPVSELSVFSSRSLGDRVQVQLYAFSGFSDSSPDLGGGVYLRMN